MTKLGKKQVAVLEYIAQQAKQHGVCWLSNYTDHTRPAIPYKVIKNSEPAVAALIEKGLVKVEYFEPDGRYGTLHGEARAIPATMEWPNPRPDWFKNTF